LLAQKAQEELSQWFQKGYSISDCSIRFIVAWRPKDAAKDEKEHAVVLADLTLKKHI
jgi:ATP-dependent DNA helicase RecQ